MTSPRITVFASTKGRKIFLVKVNPFPWFPWWPKIEETHYLPILAIGVLLAAVVAYLVL